MVLNIQRKFSYLHSIPGTYSIHRPHQNPQLDYNRLMQTLNAADEKHQMQELERQSYEQVNVSPTTKSLYLGEEALSLWSIPPLLPSDLGILFPKNPSVSVPYYAPQGFDHDNILLNSNGVVNLNNDAEGDEHVESLGVIGAIDVKVEAGGAKEDGASEEKDSPLSQSLGFELHRGAEKNVANS